MHHKWKEMVEVAFKTTTEWSQKTHQLPKKSPVELKGELKWTEISVPSEDGQCHWCHPLNFPSCMSWKFVLGKHPVFEHCTHAVEQLCWVPYRETYLSRKPTSQPLQILVATQVWPGAGGDLQRRRWPDCQSFGKWLGGSDWSLYISFLRV